MRRRTAVRYQRVRNLQVSVRRDRPKCGQEADFVTYPNRLETALPYTLESVSPKVSTGSLVSDTVNRSFTNLHKVGLVRLLTQGIRAELEYAAAVAREDSSARAA